MDGATLFCLGALPKSNSVIRKKISGASPFCNENGGCRSKSPAAGFPGHSTGALRMGCEKWGGGGTGRGAKCGRVAFCVVGGGLFHQQGWSRLFHGITRRLILRSRCENIESIVDCRKIPLDGSHWTNISETAGVIAHETGSIPTGDAALCGSCSRRHVHL